MSALPSNSDLRKDRRAHTFLSSSNITSSDAFPDHWATGRDETSWDHEYDDEIHATSEDGDRTPQPNDTLGLTSDDLLQHLSATNRPNTNERTPLLLNKKGSFQGRDFSTPEMPGRLLERSRPGNPRRSSAISIDVKRRYGGTSTFGQTVRSLCVVDGWLTVNCAFSCSTPLLFFWVLGCLVNR